MTPEKENEIYKTMTACLGSALVTMMGAYMLATHDTVTKAEMPGYISQYSPYTSDQKEIKGQIDSLAVQTTTLQDQVRQLQIDTARISEKLGVPAHPGDPNGDFRHRGEH